MLAMLYQTKMDMRDQVQHLNIAPRLAADGSTGHHWAGVQATMPHQHMTAAQQKGKWFSEPAQAVVCFCDVAQSSAYEAHVDTVDCFESSLCWKGTRQRGMLLSVLWETLTLSALGRGRVMA